MGDDVLVMSRSTTDLVRQSETLLEALALTHLDLAALLVDLDDAN